MPPNEPSREWQHELHNRILENDPIAFAELCEEALFHVLQHLENAFPMVDAHTRETIVHDLLLNYHKRPKQYNPSKLSLFAYLRMAATADIRNETKRQQRRARRLADVDDPVVELELQKRNTLQELDLTYEDTSEYSLQEIRAELESELNTTERCVLALLLDDVRETSRYAEAMEITHLDDLTQAREVKRVKDRLKKRMERLGKRLRGR